MPRSKSSRRWLKEHFDDEFVKRAQAEGFRSRAVYKLQEIQQRDRLIRPGMTVVDLGAAPGGWSQYAVGLVGRRGRVVALDILAMDPIPGVEVIQGDFREQEALDELLAVLGGKRAVLVFQKLGHPGGTGHQAPGADVRCVGEEGLTVGGAVADAFVVDDGGVEIGNAVLHVDGQFVQRAE